MRVEITSTNIELMDGCIKGRLAHNGTYEVFRNGKTVEQFKKNEVIKSKCLNNEIIKEVLSFEQNLKVNKFNFVKHIFTIEEIMELNKSVA